MSAPNPDDRCAKCDGTYSVHLGPMGALYPCWTPTAPASPSIDLIAECFDEIANILDRIDQNATTLAAEQTDVVRAQLAAHIKQDTVRVRVECQKIKLLRMGAY